ncbi:MULTISPECIES: electron transfer flavoprotein subunit alpha [Bacillus]|uniref:electron transfer flavoprotein subunit alpha n=1 Tax=Bacillus TaxID=1386 RepID=UPI0002F7CD6E|nr:MULTISPECIES: electron transfer flavoprotein subunit alpha [Bacillus]
MSLLNKVLVFSEDLTSYSELCAGANLLGVQTVAIAIGSKEEAERICSYGAKTYWLGEKVSSAIIEDYTIAIADIIRNEKPNLVLMKATKSGKLIAGRLGIILSAGVVPDAVAFEIENEANLTIQRLVFGGSAVRTEKPVTDIVISLVGSGVFEVSHAETVGEFLTVDNVTVENKVTCVEVRPKEGESVDLGVAKRVVSVGRGLAKQEDLAMIEELASTVGAEVGCTRPIAEGENWMATGRYIGVSGAMIKPDIYFALGISGQVQHMVGVNGAKTIIAVNKDKNAPIFNYADYGIVGDIYKVVPELIKLAKN